MKALDALIDVITNDAEVQAYQRLEKAIEEHAEYHETYRYLMQEQKKLVQSTVYQRADKHEREAQYQSLLEQLSEDPIINNYLEHQENINRMLQWIAHTVEARLEEALEVALKAPLK